LDEAGERWEAPLGGLAALELVPGTPVLATASYPRPYQNQSEARRFDLSGKCRAEFQGQFIDIPLTLAGLTVAQQEGGWP
jgi:hypothetical protein